MYSVELMSNLYEIFSQTDGISANFRSFTLKGDELLRLDMRIFIAYILNEESYKLSKAEKDYIRQLVGDYDYIKAAEDIVKDSGQVEEYIKRAQIYEMMFRLDFASIEMGDTKPVFTTVLTSCYPVVVSDLIKCDSRHAKDKKERLSNYIAMLTERMENERKIDEARLKKQFKMQNGKVGELLDELDSMIGLENVKKEITGLINFQSVQKMKRDRGMKTIDMSNHMVFYGNPGTGKTTVARIIAGIYHELGIVSTGTFIEAERNDFVGGYLGQTALKTSELIEKALGGVLFIDEAYSLARENTDDQYGLEAIDCLIKGMEDHRDDLIVIVAGYTKEMQAFLDANPGLRSRFNKYLEFEDYDENELRDIFLKMCSDNDMTVEDDAMDYLIIKMSDMIKNKDKNFANARAVRNYFERALTRQANRLCITVTPTDSQLNTFTREDLYEE